MADTPVKAPFAVVRYGDPTGKRSVSAISIALSEPVRSVIPYRVRVDCEFSGGLARLGQVRTVPPSAAGIPSRVIAICCAPGVIAWRVRATPVRPYNASDVAGTLKVDGWDQAGTLPGITPLSGSLLEAGGPDAGNYNQSTGLAPGAATVPAGARVRGWSFEAGGAPATAVITSPVFGALPTITVPVGGAFTDNPDGLLGPATFTFAGGVSRWWVSWLERL